MTTENTITKKVGSVTYTDYPSIETLDNKDIDWIDALIMNNAYLAAAGGDYDGREKPWFASLFWFNGGDLTINW